MKVVPDLRRPLRRSLRAAALALFAAAFFLLPAGPSWAQAGAAAPNVAAGGLRLQGDSFAPYRIARARLEAEEGIVGAVSVTGTYWDDSSRLLFSAKANAWSASFDLAFYVDEDLKSLAIRAETSAGPRELEVDLAAAALASAVPDAAEVGRRAEMRGLPLPYLDARVGRAPARLVLASVDLKAAAIGATEACLVREPPIAALAVLALLVLGAAALGSLRHDPAARRPGKDSVPDAKSPPRPFLVAARLALALLSLAALLALLPTTAVLTRVELPEPDAAGAYKASLEARSGMAEGVRLTDFVMAGEGAGAGDSAAERHLDLVAAATPGPRGIPLDLIVPAGRDCRFASRPLITLRDGKAELRFDEPSLGWTAWR